MWPRQFHTNSGSGIRSAATGGTGSGIEAASRARRIRRTAPFGSVLAPDATATPYSWRRRSLVCWSSSCQARHQVDSFLSEAGSRMPSASRARAISFRATRSCGLTTFKPISQSRRRASSESTPAGTARSLTRVACRPKPSHSHLDTRAGERSIFAASLSRCSEGCTFRCEGLCTDRSGEAPRARSGYR